MSSAVYQRVNTCLLSAYYEQGTVPSSNKRGTMDEGVKQVESRERCLSFFAYKGFSPGLAAAWRQKPFLFQAF